MTVYVVRSSRVSPCTVLELHPNDRVVELSDPDGSVQSRAVNLSSLLVSTDDNVEPEEDPPYSDPFADVRARLKRFYAKHAPGKTDEEMDKAIRAYAKHPKGHPGMFEALVSKYGPEPEAKSMVATASEHSSRRHTNSQLHSETYTVACLLRIFHESLTSEHARAVGATQAAREVAKGMVPCLSLLAALPGGLDGASMVDAATLNDQDISTFCGGQGGAISSEMDFLSSGVTSEANARSLLPLAAGTAVAVVLGPHLGKTGSVVSERGGVVDLEEHGTSAVRLQVSRDAVVPLLLSGSVPAWTADTPSLALVASADGEMFDGNWTGSLLPQCRVHFAFTFSLKQGTATLSISTAGTKSWTTHFKLSRRRVNRETRTVSFYVVLDELSRDDSGYCAELSSSVSEGFDRSLRELELNVAHMVHRIRFQPCEETVDGVRVLFRFEGVALVDGSLSGMLVVPSGRTATAIFLASRHGQRSGPARRADILPNITKVKAPRGEETGAVAGLPPSVAVVSPLIPYAAQLALHIHVAALPYLPPPSFQQLLHELLHLASRHETAQDIGAVLQHTAAQAPDTLARLLNHACEMCCRSPKREALCASRLVVAALEVSAPELEPLPEAAPSLFWQMFFSVLCAAHRFSNVWSAVSNVVPLVAKQPGHRLTAALIAPLYSHFEREFQRGTTSPKLLSSIADIYALVFPHGPQFFAQSQLPLRQAVLLVDFARCIAQTAPVPACCDDRVVSRRSRAPWSPASGTADVRGTVLTQGRVASHPPLQLSSRERVYFEVVLPTEARVVIGLGNENFAAKGNFVGYDADSIGCDGNAYMHDCDYVQYGCWEPRAGCVLGCRLDLVNRTVGWSLDGDAGPDVPIPPQLLGTSQSGSSSLHAAVGTQKCSTSKVELRTSLSQLAFLPPKFEPLQTVDVATAANYDPSLRSSVAPKDAAFYADVAAWVSTGTKSRAISAPDLIDGELAKYTNHLAVAEACLLNCLPFIDLESSSSQLVGAFLSLKYVLVSCCRAIAMALIGPCKVIEARHSLTVVTVRWFRVLTGEARTPQCALENSVLGQLYQQIGSNHALLSQTPMFSTALMMANSGHTPIDAGGPYNQVWSLLSEEMMADPDRANFSRNPLFRFAQTSNGKWIVPDASRKTPYDLQLLRFTGQIMGHMVRAKSPLALEISPFVWAFLVEDSITCEDYMNSVDGFWREYLSDEEFLSSDEQIAQFFPGFKDRFQRLSRSPGRRARLSSDLLRKAAVEKCIVHCLDEQLIALREGLWNVLGRACVRALTASGLELLVCGEPHPTWEQVQGSIGCHLPEPQAGWFWTGLKSLDPLDWSKFFYFASAQRRYPLTKKITVHSSGQSPDHWMTASTCFATVHCPMYRSPAEMRKMLEKSIGCTDMELA